MGAGADKTESQLAAGKHTFLKKVDENFSVALFSSFELIKCVAQGNSHKKII